MGEQGEEDDKDTEDDAVDAEGLEVVLFDEAREEADGCHRDDECDGATKQKDGGFGGREGVALEEEFEQTQGTRAEHDRNGQVEGEFCCDGA